MIYFDNSATTKVDEKVLNEINKYMEENYFNIDSQYKGSIELKKILVKKLDVLNKRLGLNSNDFVFTSGGGEANNLALCGIMRASKQGHLLISSIEHPSISQAANQLKEEGYEVEKIEVDKFGNIDIEDLKSKIKENTKLVSIIGVNNEIGTIQKMDEIGEVIKSINPNTYHHIDFVQGLNHVEHDFSKSKVDLLSISSHKIHGPKGIGALYIKKGTKIKKQIYGENNFNKYIPRTFPHELVLGFLKAIEIHEKSDIEYIENLKAYFLSKLFEIEKYNINTPVNSTPAIINVSFIGVKAEVLQSYMSSQNIYISTGSACSSNKGHSDIIQALKLDDKIAESSVRISFSKYNTIDEIDKFFEVIKPFLSFASKIK